MVARPGSMWTQLAVLVAAALHVSVGAAAAEERPRTKSALAEEVVARRELVTAAYRWLEATLARDFAAQSRFYPERMPVFYLWRDVPKPAVMAEKRRVFERAQTVRIRMEPPQLLVDPGARSGRMYFRKTYVIRGKVNRTGEVLQELRWIREADGWKIVSERDLRVLHPVDPGR